MTRLLFLPNDQTFLLLESPLPAGAVIDSVHTGQWTPPEPYGSLLSELKPSVVLQTFQQGTLVVITTSRPVDLDGEALLNRTRGAHSTANFLTDRQSDVLQYLTEGLTTKEIALRLGLQPRTVLMHVAALKRRLGASTRAQSVMRAASLGLCKTGAHPARDVRAKVGAEPKRQLK